jgi:hypothetical protein
VGTNRRGPPRWSEGGVVIAIHLPSLPSISDAFDWLAAQGHSVIRLVMYRGADGLIRGSALVRERAR